MKGTFGYDREFLSKHKNTILLTSPDKQSTIAIVPDYQARVMTSSSSGDAGNSYGWLNYSLIESGKFNPQISVFGGEERFWLGPEGGQYSIFFKNGSSFDFADWNTPACIDTESYELVSADDSLAMFTKAIELVNYSNTRFNVRVDRAIQLLKNQEIESSLGVKLPKGIRCVAYKTTNTIINQGKEDWTKEKGLLSIWLLGMYRPGDKTLIVVPYKKTENAASMINDRYFGKIPPERLSLTDSCLFMKADGKSRGKIGIPPALAQPVCGSYDPDKNILTLIKFNLGNDTCYVNSMWEMQKEPYHGDVVNAYNDGPVNEKGDQLGPFYELETSSAAKELKTGESLTHIQETIHFEGSEEMLDSIASSVLGVSIADINTQVAKLSGNF